jgi:hypothetical protein
MERERERERGNMLYCDRFKFIGNMLNWNDLEARTELKCIGNILYCNDSDEARTELKIKCIGNMLYYERFNLFLTSITNIVELRV